MPPLPTLRSGADPAIRFATVILAAGASSRMGQPKLLLPWGSTSILDHLLRQWRALGATGIAVVMAKDDRRMEEELQRRGWDTVARIINPDPARGMFSSIQSAAAWDGWETCAHLTHWVLSLGDQPHVRESTLVSLIQCAAEQPDCVWQPSRQGRARHPVIFPADLFRNLASATEPDLKAFLANRAGRRQLMEADDPGLDLDLDYPADYEKARALIEPN